jgi:hypothetical protein
VERYPSGSGSDSGLDIDIDVCWQDSRREHTRGGIREARACGPLVQVGHAVPSVTLSSQVDPGTWGRALWGILRGAEREEGFSVGCLGAQVGRAPVSVFASLP